MWIVVSLDLSAVPGAQAFVSDGNPAVGYSRGGAGISVRLMIPGVGFLDITDLGAEAGGPQPCLLVIGNAAYWNGGEAALAIAVAADGVASVSGDGNAFAVPLTPFAQIDPADFDLFATMITDYLVPYPELPPGGRPYTDVIRTAGDYFPWSVDAAALGLAIYDWTTADFFRMDIFNFYRYTALPGIQLSAEDLADAVWTSDWPPYQPGDANFMASMLMQPAASRDAVAAQLAQVSGTLAPMLDSLKRVTAAVLASLPRTSVMAVPALYSGQVDVANLGAGAFATYFLEYPGNAGPPGTPMGMDLGSALATFMAPGQVVTLKSFMSTTDSQADALHYANGILLVIAPDAAAPVWTRCAHVTPLSNEAAKTEYLFEPGSAFVMGQSYQETVGNKTVTVLPMTCTQ